MVENIVGKGENADYQHFLLFPQRFQKASFIWVLKKPRVNLLLHDNILVLMKLTFYQITNFRLVPVADNIMNVTQCDSKMKFVFGRAENILEKGKNAGDMHFLLFPKCFQKPLSSGFY